MTGTIRTTNHAGGFIRNDEDGRSVRFKWCDCDDIGPLDCGHDTKVRFYVTVESNREFAIAVKRAETTK